MWQIILPIVVVYLLTILISLFLTLDKLVRLEYSDHRPMWEKDGKPRGVFWRASETRKLFGIDIRSEWAFNRLSFVWLFSTPEWMHSDPRAIRLVNRLRILTFIWNASILLPIIVILVMVQNK